MAQQSIFPEIEVCGYKVKQWSASKFLFDIAPILKSMKDNGADILAFESGDVNSIIDLIGTSGAEISQIVTHTVEDIDLDNIGINDFAAIVIAIISININDVKKSQGATKPTKKTAKRKSRAKKK